MFCQSLHVCTIHSWCVDALCWGKFGKQMECSPADTVMQPDQLVKLLSVG